MIYLDYNSTTPVDPRVLEAMLPYFSEKFGNASSKTHSFGWVAEAAVEKAREQLAALIGATPQEIIFTSGATESVNLALKGLWEALLPFFKEKGKEGELITVSTEHKAVLDTCRYLETKGAKVTYLPVTREGLVDLNRLRAAINAQTILVCVMHANNETGVIQPIAEIAKIAHEKGCLFMTDATQAAGKIKLDVQADGIDLLAMSSHKIYGPKGTGALYVRSKNPRVTLSPLIHGGGHERGLRSGTLNVPAIAGFGKAAEIAVQEMQEDALRISRLRTQLEQSLLATGNVYMNGSSTHRLPNVTNLSFKGIKADRLIAKLPDIAFSAGSACSSAVPAPSHVLRAMGLTDEMAYASVRFSLGRPTTKEEVEEAAAKIKIAAGHLRR